MFIRPERAFELVCVCQRAAFGLPLRGDVDLRALGPRALPSATMVQAFGLETTGSKCNGQTSTENVEEPKSSRVGTICNRCGSESRGPRTSTNPTSIASNGNPSAKG